MTQHCLINGQPRDTVSVMDRGLQYGDGVFETALITGGRVQAWAQHQSRLITGCARLAIEFNELSALAQEIEQLCSDVERAVLKVIITRGISGRGYRPLPRVAAGPPTRIVQVHPAPSSGKNTASTGRVIVCRTPWAINPRLAQIKHLNRLEQILARAECPENEVEEGLMLDTNGHVISATAANLFIIRAGQLLTPDVTSCGVAGITRSFILELAPTLGLTVSVCALTLKDVMAADEVFLTNSLIGVRPIVVIDANTIPRGPMAPALSEALQRRLARE